MRVSASVGLGMVALEPMLPDFWQAFPNIALDLSISDEVVDISSLAVATDVISVTMMSVPFAIWVAVASRVLTAKDIWLLESATPDSAVLTRPMNVLKFLPIAPNSPADDSSMRFVRSPCERLSRDLSRSFNGPRIALALQ